MGQHAVYTISPRSLLTVQAARFSGEKCGFESRTGLPVTPSPTVGGRSTKPACQVRLLAGEPHPSGDGTLAALRRLRSWFDSRRMDCEDVATAAERAHTPLPKGQPGSIPGLATARTRWARPSFIRRWGRFDSVARDWSVVQRQGRWSLKPPIPVRVRALQPNHPSLGPRWAACFGYRTPGRFDSCDSDHTPPAPAR